MDALKFINEARRFCRATRETTLGCNGCSMKDEITCNLKSMLYNEYLKMKSEDIIDIVEKWSEEHPRITNGDVLHDNLPLGTSIDYKSSQGRVRVEIPTEWWNAEYEGK